jgi:hypothetical protein
MKHTDIEHLSSVPLASVTPLTHDERNKSYRAAGLKTRSLASVVPENEDRLQGFLSSSRCSGGYHILQFLVRCGNREYPCSFNSG